MAEQKSKKKPKVADVAVSALRQLGELTGRRAESVLGVERDDDGGGWHVTVELLELERVPNSTDLLGIYVVTLDDDGDIVEYRRTRRYARGTPDEDGR
jgi:gas vesicle protein GvpO